MSEDTPTGSPRQRSGKRVALNTQLPRRFRIVNYIALVPLVAAMIWAVANLPDDHQWPAGLAYLALALVLIGLPLAFAQETWAQVGAKGSQLILSALILLAYVDMIRDATPPLWVPLAFYGSLAVIAVATVVGKVVAYREARHGEGQTD